MIKIGVRKYKPDDMIAILGEAGKDIAQTRGDYGPAFTFFCADKILACAGVTIYWEGTGEAWLCPSEYFKDFKKEVAVWTREALDFIQKEYALRRIHADVVASNPVARRYVEHYGFVAEGKMTCYDALGRDCIRYARIREVA